MWEITVICIFQFILIFFQNPGHPDLPSRPSLPSNLNLHSNLYLPINPKQAHISYAVAGRNRGKSPGGICPGGKSPQWEISKAGTVHVGNYFMCQTVIYNFLHQIQRPITSSKNIMLEEAIGACLRFQELLVFSQRLKWKGIRRT